MVLVNYVSQRTWLNLKRHKLTILVSVSVLALMTLAMSAIYPGDQAFQDFLDIPVFQLFLGTTDLGSLGIVIWILILIIV